MFLQKMIKTKKIEYLSLALILLIGAFFRFYGLREQGFFFFDEGLLIYRAAFLKSVLLHLITPEQWLSTHVDSKPFWLISIILSQIVNNTLSAPQLLSAYAGIMTVFTVYLLAKKLYDSSTALIGSLILSISSYHIFYSRLALPEATSVMLMMLAIYLYVCFIRRHVRLLIIPSILASASFLMNYKVLPALAIVLFFECSRALQFKDDKNNVILRYGYFLAGFLVCVGIFSNAHVILKQVGIFWPSYSDAFQTHFSRKLISLNAESLTLYFSYILKYEGLIVLSLLFTSILFIRSKNSTAFPLFSVFLYIIICSVMNEKPARTFVMALPFLAILSAVVLLNLGVYFNKWGKGCFVKTILIIIIFFISMMKSTDILAYRSDMGRAVAYIKSHYGNSMILTTNWPLTNLAAYPVKSSRIIFETIDDIRQMYNDGARTLITDPQRFIQSTASHHWLDHQTIKFLMDVDQKCDPVRIYPHYNQQMMRRFLDEHILTDTKNLNQFLDDMIEKDGNLSVYDLKNCLEKLTQ